MYIDDEPMLFNSGLFLLMLLFVLFFYRLLYKFKTARIAFLTCFSIYFYYKSCGVFTFLILASAILDFSLSHLIYKQEKKFYKSLLLCLSLIVNLGNLFYFKYTNFFIEIFNQLQNGQAISPIELFLPIGISFYTFENISYTIDVYRGQFKPINSLLDYTFFLTFFPKLVAGPIVRASDFIPQIRASVILAESVYAKATLLICGGLIKKSIISDYIGINFVDRIFDNPTLYTGMENLLAVYGYTIQIFCDFSGYSDIAIGIAMWLGFSIPDNFKTPYRSTSITEFWRRWHISLSSWLRDYLYIPLGGNRKGKFRQYINLIITMLLGGLWHGASWKFILWGALHGLALAIEKLFEPLIRFPKNNFVLLFKGLLTFHFVAFCWIWFRASDFANAQEVIKQISFLKFDLFFKIIFGYKWVFALIGIAYLWHFLPFEKLEIEKNKLIQNIYIQAFVLGIVMWLVSQVKSSEIQPFIYFQF